MVRWFDVQRTELVDAGVPGRTVCTGCTTVGNRWSNRLLVPSAGRACNRIVNRHRATCGQGGQKSPWDTPTGRAACRSGVPRGLRAYPTTSPLPLAGEGPGVRAAKICLLYTSPSPRDS